MSEKITERDYIESAILRVYQAVGYVQKHRGKDGGIPYTFAGEAALLAALRPAMVEAGITMRVHSVYDVRHEAFQTSRGNAMNRVTLSATIRFAHAASDTSVDVQAVGEGSDSGDKATAKALTSAFKYALRETFAIETGDDPDDERVAASPAKKKSAAKPRSRPDAESPPPPEPPPGEPEPDEKPGPKPKAARKTATSVDQARATFYAELKTRGVDPRDSMLVHALIDADCGNRPHSTGGSPKETDCHALREIIKREVDSGTPEPDAWRVLIGWINNLTDERIATIRKKIRPDA